MGKKKSKEQQNELYFLKRRLQECLKEKKKKKEREAPTGGNEHPGDVGNRDSNRDTREEIQYREESEV